LSIVISARIEKKVAIKSGVAVGKHTREILADYVPSNVGVRTEKLRLRLALVQSFCDQFHVLLGEHNLSPLG